jgi:hypothetical protein
MNMMRKNNNRNNNRNRNNSGGGGQRRYGGNNGGGGNRSGQNDGQNIQRQKHHATQQLARYNDLARNAQNNGDRVDVEYYLQHIDHYNRVLASIAEVEAERYNQYREVAGTNDAAPMGDGSESSAAPEGAENTEGQAGDPQQQRHHRQHRQPRRQHYSQNTPQADESMAPANESGNGAAEANANTTEIPLPGNILPPI